MDLKSQYRPTGNLLRSLSGKFALPMLAALVALLLGMLLMHVFRWDLSIPWDYPKLSQDQIWQLTLSKTLLDNGWVLNSHYLGAPAFAQWYANPAAQTSSLHSVLMLGLSLFIHNAVKVQQVYYLLNFPLIAMTSFLACRLLGLARIPATAIAILYPFVTYRFNFQIYAYLANYSAIPLALVAVYWALNGDYSAAIAPGERFATALRRSLGGRKFCLGALFVTLVALSDGYYAFFTLLLLGFALGARIVCGDIRRPHTLVAPLALITILITVALTAAWPLTAYKRAHIGEFYPNGIEDPALVKHPFEAEVYASNLVMLLAPAPGIHRVPELAQIGKEMLNSTNESRFFKTSDIAPLGLLGSSLFIISLVLMVYVVLRQRPLLSMTGDGTRDPYRVLWASVGLSFFIFLCSISGGVGSLIAFIYPEIRAYQRFPIFLIFVLYIGAGAALTQVLKSARLPLRVWWMGSVVALICVLSLLDQIPANSWHGTEESQTRYLAEQSFVHHVEAELPAGAMVYNYPYSQYLVDSKYYGWGGFSHIRLYLHSTKLHWSNGASKNSPVDDWHARLARLPPAQLATELSAVGFRGMVIDRSVVGDDEYNQLSAALQQVTGQLPTSDAASKLAYVPLDDPGYRLTYDPSFVRLERITVFDKRRMSTAAVLPRLINRDALEQVLAASSDSGEIVVDRASHPAVFRDPTVIDRGTGDYVILPKADLKGLMQCSLASGARSARIDDTVVLRLTNNSDFDWQLNGGKYPLRVGINLYELNGTLFDWDRGIRVPGKWQVAKGASIEMRYPIALIDTKLRGPEQHNYIVQFALVQDGSTWFDDIACRVRLER
jgi:hypothetical protein